MRAKQYLKQGRGKATKKVLERGGHRAAHTQQDSVLRAQASASHLMWSLVKSWQLHGVGDPTLPVLSGTEFWLTGLPSAPCGWYLHTDWARRHCFGIDVTALRPPEPWDHPEHQLSSGVSSFAPLRSPS